jgi:uncharacterized protein (TIGR02145 family)
MKSTTGWNAPNIGATNSSGFAGLPGGYRFNGGSFVNVGSFGYWWSSAENFSAVAWYRYLYYGNSNVYIVNDDKRLGFSVRCIRD